MRKILLPAALTLLAQPALAQCGGPFPGFLDGVAQEAIAQGLPEDAVRSFLKGAAIDPKVLEADRRQGIFRKPFTEFSRNLISDARLRTAQGKLTSEAATLKRAAEEYGIPGGILMAFWAFETDFGNYQGDFVTRNALLTLAHDCRRPELFRPQVLAAIRMHALGEFPLGTTGAWAGEIGMVQMLPADILERGVDGDGDGLVLLKTSVPDAMLSGANMLRHHGWRAGEPWLAEVTVPSQMDWSQSGLNTARPLSEWQALGVVPRADGLPDLPASLILPEGRKGPAFLAFANFRSLFDWNQSYVYVLTAAYFASRIEGAPGFRPGNPDPLLPLEEMKALQQKLAARGHDVGKVDGILGAGTRDAVQKEQARLGLPADAWPTRDLLDRL